MATLSTIEQVLEGWSGSGPWKARCPAHKDSNASLSIRQMEDGTLFLKCHAGCAYPDIKHALALRGVEMESEKRYEYEEVPGQVIFTKVRKPGKKFFIEGKVKPVLYKQPEVIAQTDRVVFVVEGEKDVESLTELGMLATCGYEGANKWREEYSQTLSGRIVFVIPDNDAPGAKYAQLSSSSLLRHGCRVKVLPMNLFYATLGKEAPEKSDISDWLQAGGTVEQLRTVANEQPFLSSADTVDPLSEDLTEKTVVASLLLNPAGQDEIFSNIRSFEFASYNCRQIMQEAEKLYQARFSVDRVTVAAQLSDEGRQFLDTLLQDNLPPGSVASHVQLVKASFARRTLVFQCGELSRMAQDQNVPIDALLDAAETKVLSIRGVSSPEDIPDISKGVIQALKEIESRVGREEGLSGLPTGLTDLDAYTDGLQPSDLILLAARPGMGKTALAMNIVEHVVLRENKKVLVFSLEMSTTQLVTRILSSSCALDGQKIKRGDLTLCQLEKLTHEASRLAKSKLLIDDTASISINQLRSRARREHKKGQLSLIVVDYLQLMRGSANSERRERELAEISGGLKALAKELNIPILALSQLNRALEARQDKKPNNSDLRESGALEQDADIILFVYRECVYNEEASPRIAELIVNKHRNGPLGSMLLEFQGNLTKFCDLIHSEPANEIPQERATACDPKDII